MTPSVRITTYAKLAMDQAWFKLQALTHFVLRATLRGRPDHLSPFTERLSGLPKVTQPVSDGTGLWTLVVQSQAHTLTPGFIPLMKEHHGIGWNLLRDTVVPAKHGGWRFPKPLPDNLICHISRVREQRQGLPRSDPHLSPGKPVLWGDE